MFDLNISENKIDFSGLSKPMVKSIELVREAIGWVGHPLGTYLQAKADRSAEITAAKTKIEVRELTESAETRRFSRERRRQRNVETIAKKAILALPEEQPTQSVEEDWVHQFFDYCEDVGDNQMQILWARLLAGEIARPLSFSPRTLWVVKHLRKQEAELFRAFCSFVWLSESGIPTAIFFSEMYDSCGLEAEDLLHLQSLNLITRLSDLGGTYTTRPNGGSIKVGYHGRHYIAWLNSTDRLPLGEVVLTEVGQELYRLSDPVENADYRDMVVHRWSALPIRFGPCPAQG